MFALSYFAPESHLLSITSDHFESKVDTTLIFTCGVSLLWCLSADIDQGLAHSAAEQTDRLNVSKKSLRPFWSILNIQPYFEQHSLLGWVNEKNWVKQNFSSQLDSDILNGGNTEEQIRETFFEVTK